MSRKLKMKFAGRFIDLLGHQMYGGSVPSVAELVANAWDADAKKVEISIPVNIAAPDAEIKVKDYGFGMAFTELNDWYLNVGYERRAIRGERTTGGRLVMGRKGIGKLAVFGIAEDMILSSVKDGKVVEFNLNYTELKSQEELKGFEFSPSLDESTTESPGVTVTLKKLKLTKNISLAAFRLSMARRFAMNSEEMEIIINGEKLTKEALQLEYRIPENVTEWQEEDIEGFGKVKFWFGFLKETIKDKEQRGCSVFARERVAQYTPFHFNLTGGFNGQVGLEYLTGQVKADDLDADIDYIATPRQSVNWQYGKAALLEEWGQKKIKELCKGWKSKRDKKKLDKLSHDYSKFADRIEALVDQEKKDLLQALEKIAKIDTIGAEDFELIAESMISGMERESVKKIIKRINSAEDEALPDLVGAMKEWDIVAAVSMAEILLGRMGIIEQFEKLIKEKTPEKKGKGAIDMHEFIHNHPWLLGPAYESLEPADFASESSMDKWIEKELNAADETFTKGEKRFDLLCIKNEWAVAILELMRPGKNLDYDHVMRLNLYVTRIQSAISARGSGGEFENKTVYGLLIADGIDKDPSIAATLVQLKNNINAVTWGKLFADVHKRYKEFFEIVEKKAPGRISGMVKWDKPN